MLIIIDGTSSVRAAAIAMALADMDAAAGSIVIASASEVTPQISREELVFELVAQHEVPFFYELKEELVDDVYADDEDLSIIGYLFRASQGCWDILPGRDCPMEPG